MNHFFLLCFLVCVLLVFFLTDIQAVVAENQVLVAKRQLAMGNQTDDALMLVGTSSKDSLHNKSLTG